MDATTEFRPSPSFLQPTSKPKGVAAGRNPNPFVFGRSRCRRSAPRSWTRHHQANNPPFSILSLLMILPPRPRRFCRSQSGIAGCSRSAPHPFPGRTHALRHPLRRPLAHACNTHARDPRGAATYAAAASSRLSRPPCPRSPRRPPATHAARRPTPWRHPAACPDPLA